MNSKAFAWSTVAASFLLALISVAVWTPLAGLATLAGEVALAFIGFRAIRGMGDVNLPYADFKDRSDPWLTAMGAAAMASFFSLVTVLSNTLGTTGLLPTIISTVGPLTFLIYLLVYNAHSAEPTIYDPFIKKPEGGKPTGATGD